ncbi:hypothetical protein CC_3451 [Caulobacter vibrioides CB15]|uniref:Uncharacterized protein n=1 Tax=Caulobacter vibrioides (strain ATCC 19089 / CIP 103742 / CB 15) TaxID=190650 RepID=Q9A2V5_CAUVC|nr:hypothetical protein CC_3451 [Caulobacter vibrioides CB15]
MDGRRCRAAPSEAARLITRAFRSRNQRGATERSLRPRSDGISPRPRPPAPRRRGAVHPARRSGSWWRVPPRPCRQGRQRSRPRHSRRSARRARRPRLRPCRERIPVGRRGSCPWVSTSPVAGKEKEAAGGPAAP